MTRAPQKLVPELRFPSLLEQEKIAACLSAVDCKIVAAERELAGTREFKKGLLQGMFV